MLRVMYRNQKPAWLEALLSEKFFAPCYVHTDLKKNERNIFCLDCSRGFCQHCLPSHSLHKVLQIRRYVYHDVIRIEDVQKLVDCSHVQPYIINSAKVVFLNQRPQPRPLKGPGNLCEYCERNLQDPYKYCSMACKVEAVMKHGIGLQALFPQTASDLLACSSSSSCCCFTSPDQQSSNERKAIDTAKKTESRQTPMGKASAKAGKTVMNCNESESRQAPMGKASAKVGKTVISCNESELKQTPIGKAAATGVKASNIVMNCNEDEDEEDQADQYCSPNSVLSGITTICTPTSSGSTAHDELTCRPAAASSHNSNRPDIAKKLRTNNVLNKATPCITTTVSLKRRKSTPHRSPIL